MEGDNGGGGERSVNAVMNMLPEFAVNGHSNTVMNVLPVVAVNGHSNSVINVLPVVTDNGHSNAVMNVPPVVTVNGHSNAVMNVLSVFAVNGHSNAVMNVLPVFAVNGHSNTVINMLPVFSVNGHSNDVIRVIKVRGGGWFWVPITLQLPGRLFTGSQKSPDTVGGEIIRRSVGTDGLLTASNHPGTSPGNYFANCSFKAAYTVFVLHFCFLFVCIHHTNACACSSFFV